MALNSAKHAMGYSPYYLVFGKEMVYPIDLILGNPDPEVNPS